jgi:hypothetical protein
MEEQSEISWNPSLERVIAEEGEKASGLAWLHGRAEAHYGLLNTYIALPVICLSTLNGFVSGASSSLFSEPTSASLGVGGVSLLTALLSTIGQFFSWAKRTESHRMSSIQYLKLSKFVGVEMALPQKERMRAKDILKVVREQSERLMEISPAIPDSIKREFQHKFHDNKCAVPEVANGIHKIHINDYTSPTTSPNFSLSIPPTTEEKPDTENHAP